MKKLETTLVIGDAHSEPGHHDKRFQALGNFIVDNKPDNIVQIGDFLSLDSINFFDNNNPLIKEGRRLKDDIDKGVKSYIAMMQPIYDLWDKQTRWKTKKYSPNLYWLLGNHEVRTYRYTQDKPELFLRKTLWDVRKMVGLLLITESMFISRALHLLTPQ